MAPTHRRAWFEQAEADLRAAGLSASGGAHEWACFHSQQAGEKALKALLYGRGFTSIITHSLRRLIRECEVFDETFRAFGEATRFLDQHFIPTRFPTGLDEELPPTRYYEKGDADACMQSARSILGSSKAFRRLVEGRRWMPKRISKTLTAVVQTDSGAWASSQAATTGSGRVCINADSTFVSRRITAGA